MISKIDIINFSPEFERPAKKLLKDVITFNFENNDIKNCDKLKLEINDQVRLIDDFLEGKDLFKKIFLALDKRQLVGICGYGRQSEKLEKYIDDKYLDVLEIKNLYISFTHQRIGIGKKLFIKTCKDMIENKNKYFLLYSSFKSGQEYWTNFLGEPYKTVQENGKVIKIWINKLSEFI